MQTGRQNAVAILLLLTVPAIANAQEVSQATASLILMSDQLLPPNLNTAVDVRWAGDDSVFLAMLGNGAVEVRLDAGSTVMREMIPPRSKPGGYWSSRFIAASQQFLVAAAGGMSLTWRSIDEPLRRSETSTATTHAIDVRENRLLLVGTRRNDAGAYAPEGAIAWVGSLDKGLLDWKPVLFADSGPGAREIVACAAVPLGAARFLADGSFFIFPGIQPGVRLYDATGVLIRTWDTGVLGIDSDCASVSADQTRHLNVDYPARMAWLNQRRIVDTAIALPDGPGLIVRSNDKGKTEWKLIALNRDGSTRSYRIPIEAAGEYFHFRGDYRAGRLALLLYETPPNDRNYAQPRLVLTAFPKENAPGGSGWPGGAREAGGWRCGPGRTPRSWCCARR